ncbi:hypothetical protein TSUD_360940 [Trifolium subterraneum]|uniref:Uncharacterized protein n=1 Tax=Trifolium subterraneum TaxID=3900 RepID=A0A2Z6NE40_TRISU|nr:hypothetical protein TSUD_360940 [Trifolium subterraneum]
MKSKRSWYMLLKKLGCRLVPKPSNPKVSKQCYLDYVRIVTQFKTMFGERISCIMDIGLFLLRYVSVQFVNKFDEEFMEELQTGFDEQYNISPRTHKHSRGDTKAMMRPCNSYKLIY